MSTTTMPAEATEMTDQFVKPLPARQRAERRIETAFATTLVGEAATALLATEPESETDAWVHQLRVLALECGVSLPDSALTSDSFYP